MEKDEHTGRPAPAGDEALDRLSRLTCRVLGTPAALVTIVAEDERRLRGGHGLPAGFAAVIAQPHVQRICDGVLRSGEPLVVRDAREEDAAGWQPIVDTGFVAWLGHPLRGDAGHALGTICVMDREPRTWSDADTETLADLAAAVVAELQWRHHAEARVAAERHYHRLVETLPSGVFAFDRKGFVTEANRALSELFGAPAESLRGRHFMEFVHPDERAAIAERFRMREEGHSHTERYEARLLVAGGRVRLAELATVSMVEDGEFAGAHGVIRDITEQRETELALQSSEAHYRQLFESMPQGVVYQDATSEITRANPAAERLLGLSLDQMIGCMAMDPRWHTIREDGTDFPGDEHPSMVALETGRAVRGVVMGVFHPDKDQYRWVLVDAVPQFRRGDHRPYQVFTTLTDITALRRAEEQISSLEEQFRHAQKMEALGRLAGGVAHDFNNLLNVIGGTATLALDDTSDTASVQRDLEEIRRASERAANLTRQLLAFSRRQVLCPSTLDLRSVIQGMERMLRRLLGEDVLLVTRCGESPVHVDVDPGQIEQVVVNLAVNARDAMPAGGTLTFELNRTEIAGDDAGALEVVPGVFADLLICDTGAGMSAETMAHIFDPFFTTKDLGKGTGLGLSTVYGILRQSGGAVTVRSEPGRGTSFRVLLPISASDVTPVPPPEDRPVNGSETLLLVEDEAAVRALTRRILLREGYTVHDAADARAALQQLDALHGRVDLVVTDVVMPGMSGRELAEEIALRWPDVRVLYTSGYTEDEVLRRGVREMAHAFLPKPYTPGALCSRVRDLLDGR